MSEEQTAVIDKPDTETKLSKEELEQEKLREEEEINRYLDGDLVDPGVQDSDRIEYLQDRLKAYELEFKSLWLQREEVDSSGKKEFVEKCNVAMRENYSRRKNAIKSLLKLGVKVHNPFGPF